MRQLMYLTRSNLLWSLKRLQVLLLMWLRFSLLLIDAFPGLHLVRLGKRGGLMAARMAGVMAATGKVMTSCAYLFVSAHQIALGNNNL